MQGVAFAMPYIFVVNGSMKWYNQIVNRDIRRYIYENLLI